MNVRQTLGSSLALLPRRDRRILVGASVAQMSTSLLDLVGVLLIGLVTALSVSSVSGSTMPGIAQSVIDLIGLNDSDPLRLVVWLSLLAGFALIAKSIINVLLNRKVLTFLAHRQAAVARRLTSLLLSSPLLTVQRRSSQETAYALINGVSFATIIILGQGVVAAAEMALLVVLAVGLFIVSPVVTVFTVVFFAVIAFVLQRIISGWAGRLGLRSSSTEVASYALIQEALHTYREIVVSKRRDRYERRFHAMRWDAANIQSDLVFMSLVPKYVFEVALVVGAALLAGSQLLTKDLAAAVATIAIFLAAGSRIVPSMLRLQTAAIVIRTASGQAAPTFELAEELANSQYTTPSPVEADQDQRSSVQVLHRTAAHDRLVPTVVVRDLSVTYPDATLPAVSHLSFDAAAGASIALVGPTGAGKSTVADLILGVIVPDSGSVLLGGLTPLAAVDRWPGALAYVPQEVAMANGTVRSNVALGLDEDEIDDERVWEALERAHLAEVLRSTRSGIETIIGENGMRLSGGQRQRLGVARALYTRPRLLVLDEATSALDAETEASITRTLRELEGDVTTITIAHRLATIRHSDLVIYLESGHATAMGTFDDVRRQSRNFDRQATLLGL